VRRRVPAGLDRAVPALIGRRAVLATGVGVALAGCTGAPPAPESKRFDPKDWDSVRAQFPLDPGLAHFAAFVLAAHPTPVRAAIDRHRAALDADTSAALHGDVDHEQRARAAAAGHLGASPGEVALTDSTTMGMGLLCAGLSFSPARTS
jgi:selenocysteine lyase/cysteine desulfurase